MSRSDRKYCGCKSDEICLFCNVPTVYPPCQNDMATSKPTPDTDPINHPPHYTAHPSGVECITITEAFNFNVGNAIKYLWRAGLKSDQTKDLEKALWYVQRELDRIRVGIRG